MSAGSADISSVLMVFPSGTFGFYSFFGLPLYVAPVCCYGGVVLVGRCWYLLPTGQRKNQGKPKKSKDKQEKHETKMKDN